MRAITSPLPLLFVLCIVSCYLRKAACENVVPASASTSSTSSTTEEVESVESMITSISAPSSETSIILPSSIDNDSLSYLKVPLTPSGRPPLTRYIYVDEETCIGCTHCSTYSPSTFYMEPSHGRARVFSQWGDDVESVKIAVETCPVDCIHYVEWEELIELENVREDIDINFKARLVSDNVPTKVNLKANKGMRCNNCPSRGCKNCPMFGVGDEVWEREERERMVKDQIVNEIGEDRSAEL
mmetsp:Transcript_2537/g.4596  ORF Transcript_2537/g.4596 Transcript_2537/m.4596 type:complete len:242 (+) Transcript_2537:107-832(+)